jgi:circadian clock protein KaiC
VIKKRVGGHENSIREYQIGPKSLEVGPPLNQFQGVLRGVPEFTGAKSGLMSKQAP